MRLAEFEQAWGGRHRAAIAVWRRCWVRFVKCLRFPPEIRRMVGTTNVIESLNSRLRQATRRRGHFPDKRAPLTVLYLVVQARQSNRANPTGRTYWGTHKASDTLAARLSRV